MLVQEDNPGIEFEYSMPSGAVKPPGDDRYIWYEGQWSECSGSLLIQCLLMIDFIILSNSIWNQFYSFSLYIFSRGMWK